MVEVVVALVATSKPFPIGWPGSLNRTLPVLVTLDGVVVINMVVEVTSSVVDVAIMSVVVVTTVSVLETVVGTVEVSTLLSKPILLGMVTVLNKELLSSVVIKLLKSLAENTVTLPGLTWKVGGTDGGKSVVVVAAVVKSGSVVVSNVVVVLVVIVVKSVFTVEGSVFTSGVVKVTASMGSWGAKVVDTNTPAWFVGDFGVTTTIEDGVVDTNPFRISNK